MQLNKKILPSLAAYNIGLPSDDVWQLPEKVVQFGTGVLLRGLPDFYINKANNKGVFNGRVVVVKSTGGPTDAFAAQNNLYTHCIKGISNGEVVESYIVNAAISRVVSANKNWPDVIDCAANPQLQIIISNTTEVGIALQKDDDIMASPPQSFPGKLLAFLFARYKAFTGSKESGMTIIPTELIVDNGSVLKNIVIRLAQINNFEENFIKWLTEANDWCNSLVDRIVPGAPPKADKQIIEENFDYTDELAIISEPYSLWAIETGSERTKKLLSFAEADKNIIITSNIQKYRELKLRLLNGTHTFACGLAFLQGWNTVNTAMKKDSFHSFIRLLMLDETIPCLVNENITQQEAEAFAGNVLSRFANPFIQHQWLAITLQYTSKMKLRCVPLICTHYNLSAKPPIRMAFCFAAYLLFVKVTSFDGKIYYGNRGEEQYPIQDDEAKRWYDLWQNNNPENVVKKALSDKSLWNENLYALPGFAASVLMYLQQLLSGRSFEELMPLVL